MSRLLEASRNYLARCYDYRAAKSSKQKACEEFVNAIECCGYDSLRKQLKAAHNFNATPEYVEEFAEVVRDMAANEGIK